MASGAATPLSGAGAAPAAGAGGSPEAPPPAAAAGAGLGGAAMRRTLSAELGLGAYQRSQADVAWAPDAGARPLAPRIPARSAAAPRFRKAGLSP